MKYAWFATPVRRSRIASSSNHAYFMKRLKDRKSTRLNSSLGYISYAVFCLKKKKMDNRIQLFEEILSFRMQAVEFDNCDVYVSVPKAASGVRAELVSVPDTLMNALAQCYHI